MPAFAFGMNHEQIKEKVKQVVIDAIHTKERHYEQKGVVVVPLALIKEEVDAGAIHVDDEKAVLCADGKLFIVDYKKQQLLKQLQLQIGSRFAHKPDAAITAITAIKNMAGSGNEKILCGEEHGRILAIDIEEHGFNALGQVQGRINSFVCHPEGTQIAVAFVAKDSADLPVPCFAISKAFLKRRSQSTEITSDNRYSHSWKPNAQYDWTEFLWQKCEHGVKNISFDGEHCITECATGYLETWRVENADENPRLIQIAKTKIK